MNENNSTEVESIKMNRIATELSDPEQIMKAIQAQKQVASLPSSDSFVAPHTPIEAKLAEIWSDIFDLEQVSIHENFFDLGGDSLTAVRALSRIHESFGVELSLDTLFTIDITVAILAKVIERQQIVQAEEQEIVLALQELEGLSDKEVEEMLRNEGAEDQKVE